MLFVRKRVRMEMHPVFSPLAIMTLVSVVLVGCSLTPGRTERPTWLVQLERVHGNLLPGQIIEMNDQRPIAFQQLLDRLSNKRLVYVGETHNEAEHHDVQLEVLKGLHAKDTRLIIGMEMFERTFQSVLDEWTAGAIDQKALLRESEWLSRWKFDFYYYEKILGFAREHNVKILALNAPRELVRKVGEFGVNALSPGEKGMIASIDTSDNLHRDYLQRVFQRHHRSPGQTFQSFYEAQCVWDDTMAETISKFVTTPEGEDKRIIVFCGAGHMIYKFGVPMRVFRKTPVPYATILPCTLKRIRGEFYGEGEPAFPPPADYLWITKDSAHKKVRLGIVAEKGLAGEEGVVVRKVIIGSPAEKAGIESGDMILSIDEETTNDMVDLKLALSGKEPGSVGRIVYQRGGKRREAEMTFLEIGAK